MPAPDQARAAMSSIPGAQESASILAGGSFARLPGCSGRTYVSAFPASPEFAIDIDSQTEATCSRHCWVIRRVGAVQAVPTPKYPCVTQFADQPLYCRQKSTGATWHHLHVQGPSGLVHTEWVTASDAGLCQIGAVGICTYTPNAPDLDPGARTTTPSAESATRKLKHMSDPKRRPDGRRFTLFPCPPAEPVAVRMVSGTAARLCMIRFALPTGRDCRLQCQELRMRRDVNRRESHQRRFGTLSGTSSY